MKAVCRNPEVISTYKNAYNTTLKDIKNDIIELNEHTGNFVQELSYGYETSTGDGLWYLDEDGTALVFEGKRNSFLNGTSFLDFEPKRVQGWSVVESQHPERGAFETRKEYYKRKHRYWVIGQEKQPEFIEMMKIDNVKKPEVKETLNGFKRSIAVVDVRSDVDVDDVEKLLIYDRRDVPTEWRIDGEIVGRNVHDEE